VGIRGCRDAGVAISKMRNIHTGMKVWGRWVSRVSMLGLVGVVLESVLATG